MPIRFPSETFEALEVKRHERRINSIPQTGRKPLFENYCNEYFEKASVRKKRPGTIQNERQAVARCQDHRITTPIIADYVDRRLKGGGFCGRALPPVSERTAQLDLVMLRNILNMAIQDGLMTDLPKMPRLRPPPSPKRRRLTPAEFDWLVVASF